MFENVVANLKSKGKFTLTSRGDCYVVSIEDNKLPTIKGELLKFLMNKEVIIDGYWFKVIGVETFAVPLETELSGDTSLLVEKMGLWHQIEEKDKRPYIAYNADIRSKDN